MLTLVAERNSFNTLFNFEGFTLKFMFLSAHGNSLDFSLVQLQPQEISPPPTANLDRSNDKVYENVTGLVKAVIEMSNRIQPAAPEEYVPMVKVRSSLSL